MQDARGCARVPDKRSTALIVASRRFPGTWSHFSSLKNCESLCFLSLASFFFFFLLPAIKGLIKGSFRIFESSSLSLSLPLHD